MASIIKDMINIMIMIIVARSKIRFSETLGHGWFGWVVSGTVAGTTKVC